MVQKSKIPARYSGTKWYRMVRKSKNPGPLPDSSLDRFIEPFHRGPGTAQCLRTPAKPGGDKMGPSGTEVRITLNESGVECPKMSQRQEPPLE